MNGLELQTFHLPLLCRYFLDTPAHAAPTVALIALHGYGSNPEAMCRLVRATVGPDPVIASLQAPFQHYSGEGPTSGIAGYNWGIRHHHPEAVQLHHAMVRHTLSAVQTRFHLPPRQCILIGFSQPVGLNYRFLGTHPDLVGGLIAICGGVPKDWESNQYQDFSTPILHISRDQDEFFPVSTVEQYPARLKVHARDVEFHLIPGTHRWPSKSKEIVRPWLQRQAGQSEELPG
jgi:predicted esterase